MAKGEKAGEPSMDEILASIRKIIAEDPAAGRKSPPAPLGGLGAEAGPAWSNRAGAPAPRKAALDDVLDMADGEQRPTAPARARPEGERTGDGAAPSWLFPAPAQAAKTVPSITVDPEPAAARPGGSKEGLNGPVTTPAIKAPAGGGGAVSGIDIGAIVPQRTEDAPAAAAHAGDRKGSNGRVPEWLSKPAVQAGGTLPASESRGAAPVRPAPAEAKPAGPSLTDLANSRTAVVAPSAAMDKAMQGSAAASPTTTAAPMRSPAETKSAAATTNGAAGVMKDPPAPAPASGVPAARVPQPRQPQAGATRPEAAAPSSGEGAPAQPVAAPTVVPVPVTDPKPVQPPASSIPLAAGSAQPLAAASAAITEAPLAAPATTSEAAVVTVPISEGPASVQRPSVLGNRSAKAASDLAPSPGAATQVRTLEDTVVDLLRPMIRQWLDENMPRMVEKALRIELAESVQPKAGPAKH